jgi:hypothetical protein
VAKQSRPAQPPPRTSVSAAAPSPITRSTASARGRPAAATPAAAPAAPFKAALRTAACGGSRAS